MKGSEKQIAWAEKIKTDFARKVADFLAQQEQKVEHGPRYQKAFEDYKSVWNIICEHTSRPDWPSSWWIDLRNVTIIDLLKSAQAHLQDQPDEPARAIFSVRPC